MTVDLFPNASVLRNNSRTFLIVHNEIRSIENAILVAADNGLVDAIVFDTYMTDTNINNFKQITSIDVNTDTITLNSHDFQTGDEIVFNSDTELFSPVNPATPYYAVVVSPNEFKVSSTFVGAMTGNTINITDTGTGTQFVKNPAVAELYYQTWKGLRTDRAFVDHMNGVISHFESIGYKINRQTNPTTDGVFWWTLSW